ncbi:hypothetical protein FOA52_003587 [Chlamydomonas sp. UWO 241]|nr:hypothetical protein FOA52_003587 [Chlamydomonas sp. UWO 241]
MLLWWWCREQRLLCLCLLLLCLLLLLRGPRPWSRSSLQHNETRVVQLLQRRRWYRKLLRCLMPLRRWWQPRCL